MSAVAMCYGHHFKPKLVAYETLDELVQLGPGGLPGLVRGKKQWKACSGLPPDEFEEELAGKVADLMASQPCLAVALRGLPDEMLVQVRMPFRKSTPLQAAWLSTAPGKMSASECMLAGDEVCFKRSTGSRITWRLGSLKLARELWEMLVPRELSGVKAFPRCPGRYAVGDKVRLLEDVQVGSCWLKAGEVVRVHDASASEVAPGPKLGKTLFKVPGTKCTFTWLGCGWVPYEKVELVEALA